MNERDGRARPRHGHHEIDHDAHHGWIDRREYPFRSRWFDTADGRLHYIDEGDGNDGPVVFVHGVPTWSYNFRHLISRLRATHRCIAIDHLGFGLSDKPPTTSSYKPAALAGHLEALLGQLGVRTVTLVVHDWGGPIGLEYALRHPSNVARVVVLNSWLWSARGDAVARAVAWLLASPVYAALEDRFAVTARFFTRLAIARRGSVSADTFRHYVEPFRRRADRAGLKALVRAIRHEDAWVGSQWDRRDRIAHLPALILWGMRDPAFPPRYLDRWTTLLPRAEVHRFAGVGHYPHEEASDEVCARVLAFMVRA